MKETIDSEALEDEKDIDSGDSAREKEIRNVLGIRVTTKRPQEIYMRKD